MVLDFETRKCKCVGRPRSPHVIPEVIEGLVEIIRHGQNQSFRIPDLSVASYARQHIQTDNGFVAFGNDD